VKAATYFTAECSAIELLRNIARRRILRLNILLFLVKSDENFLSPNMGDLMTAFSEKVDCETDLN